MTNTLIGGIITVLSILFSSTCFYFTIENHNNSTKKRNNMKERIKYISIIWNKILCFFLGDHNWIYPCGSGSARTSDLRFCWVCEKMQRKGLKQKYPNYNITGSPYCLIEFWKTMPRWWTNEILYGKQQLDEG